jgi:hypothetical protein
MGTLAEAALTALRGFAGEVSTWTNQGSLVSIENHIAQIESAVAQDVHAGETAAKAVFADLYGAFHGHIASAEAATVYTTPAPAAPAPEPVAAPIPAPVADVPAAPAAPVAAPVAADPTPAPSITEAVSSAPSSETSTASSTATDTPAASA